MEWTKYTTKEALKDNDELMILDKDANANKRTLMSKIWDYVVDKMTTAVIAKLGTTNKTLIGAVNELNSNRFKIRSYIIDNTTAFKITKVVKWKNSNDHMVALLLADVNRYADIYIIGRLSGVNILSKTSNVDTPQIDSSSSTLTVTLGAWSSALLICFESVTIS